MDPPRTRLRPESALRVTGRFNQPSRDNTEQHLRCDCNNHLSFYGHRKARSMQVRWYLIVARPCSTSHVASRLGVDRPPTAQVSTQHTHWCGWCSRPSNPFAASTPRQDSSYPPCGALPEAVSCRFPFGPAPESIRQHQTCRKTARRRRRDLGTDMARQPFGPLPCFQISIDLWESRNVRNRGGNRP